MDTVVVVAALLTTWMYAGLVLVALLNVPVPVNAAVMLWLPTVRSLTGQVAVPSGASRTILRTNEQASDPQWR